VLWAGLEWLLVSRRSRVGFVGPFLFVLLLGALAPAARAQPADDPAAALAQAMAAAEDSLSRGELSAAESRYREALLEGWVLKAALEGAEGRPAEARDAVKNASPFRVARPQGLRSLGTAELLAGEAAAAVETLTELVEKTPGDPDTLRLLARALAAAGKADAAAQKLEAAGEAASADPEQTFLVAIEYLWLGRPEAAERLFARALVARPLPQTHVLIGRSYRDAGQPERARKELERALAQDPSVRRAHYYLGMLAFADVTAPDRLDRAIAEFREELKLAPGDPLASSQLGVALLDAGRPEEALPALQDAARGEPRAVTFAHVARAELALGRPAEAVAAARRGLERGREQGASDSDLEKIHYQLGLALRKTGALSEAASHLGEARKRAGASAEESSAAAAGTGRAASPLAGLPLAARQELRSRVREGLARAYFNLGVLQTQGPSARRPAERFARAAAFLEKAAEVDPDFPQVSSALGVAYFNAREFDKATGPLSRAVAAPSAAAETKRMLAMAWINIRAYDKAVPLLRDDPEREKDASLQTAYGMALLRSGRPAEAERILAGLLEAQGESVELLVLLGQAQAAQKKDDLAITTLRRALARDAKAADADATLGGIHLRRGRPQEALPHLEAAARLAPGDAAVREQLAQAYQKLGRTELANRELEAARELKARP
jgi:tetratricopeptide (TPR) repeat protein